MLQSPKQKYIHLKQREFGTHEATEHTYQSWREPIFHQLVLAGYIHPPGAFSWTFSASFIQNFNEIPASNDVCKILCAHSLPPPLNTPNSPPLKRFPSLCNPL
ncbi:hypothetical protein CEXT_271181 [Caerostris extrusa]|uniref:Uncharacterized protein n=1 Tax=Caerostris extrusa TaxID=172846 RepID=A0AAV4Y3P4_CAEEX|nr:hypothetical protein CEXT_271181 [Caerostris extrusa]